MKTDEVADNILKRDFYASRPDEKWLSDVTGFTCPHTGKKLYLCAILDLYDRCIISYTISPRNDNLLVFSTFKEAIIKHPDAHPVFHSDRGSQYTSPAFKHMLEEQGMTQSMSRVSRCIDNGPMEGLWGILKTEINAEHSIRDEASLRTAIIEEMNYYMNERLQERYDNQTPMQVRQAAIEAIARGEEPKSYPIPENKRIKKYRATIRLKQQAVASL